MIRLSVSQPQRLLTGTALAVAILLSACNKNRGDDYDLAKESMAKAETSTAIIHLKSALQKEPNRWEARALLGYALMRTGDASGAVVELEKAYTANFNPDEVVPALATLLLQTGKPQLVISRFANTKLQTPNAKASLLASLGVAYWQTEQKSEAEVTIAKALELIPTQSNALLLKANIAASRGDMDGAIGIMTWLIERNPKDLQAMLLLSQFQRLGKNDPVAAEHTLLKAIETEPRFLEAQKSLLVYRLEIGDISGAKKRLEAVRSVAPKHPVTHYLTALTAYAEGNFPIAREALQPLLRSSDSDGGLQILAGMIEYRTRSFVKAEAHLTKGLQLLPDLSQPRLTLAELYKDRDQLEKALGTLAPLLERKPPDVDAVGTAADIYMHGGDLARAESMYALAAKLSPESNQAKAALAAVRLTRGGGDREVRELEALSKLSKPNDIFAEMAIFNAKLRGKDLDGAMQAVDSMAKKQPGSALPWFLKAGLFELKDDAALAKSSFEQAQKLDPTNFRVASRLAAYDAQRGDFENAVKRFDPILKADPNHTPSKLAQVEFRRRSGTSGQDLIAQLDAIVRGDPASPAARTGLVNELLRQNQNDKALDAAQSAAAALPNAPRVWLALGDAQLRASNLEQAIGSFRKLSTMLPKDAYAPFRLAEAQMQAGQKVAAIASLKHSLEIKPNYLQAQRALAAILLRSGDHAEALKVARAIQAQRPKKSFGFLLEGDIEISRKRLAAAMAAYRNALQREPSPEVASKLHQAMLVAGDINGAALFASSWRKSAPGDAQFISYLSEQALLNDKCSEAEPLLRDFLTLVPNRANAWGSLAHCLLKLKRPGASEAAIKAVQLSPNTASLHQILARTHLESGAISKAIASQREAVRLSNANPDFKLELARLLIRSGDKAAAKAALTELSNSKTNFNGKSDISELLRGL